MILSVLVGVLAVVAFIVALVVSEINELRRRVRTIERHSRGPRIVEPETEP